MMHNVGGLVVGLFAAQIFFGLASKETQANSAAPNATWTQFSASRKAKFGRPFSSGATPDQSVRAALAALDPQTQVQLTASYRFPHRSKISLSYDYLINGIKVEQAFVKAIVELQAPHRIHLLQVQAPTSIRAQGKPAPHKIPAKGGELIYLLDEASGQAALVYKVKSIGGTLAEPENFLSFYEASTGKLLKRESLVHHHSAQAEVEAFAIEGLTPYSASNPAILHPVSNALVQIAADTYLPPQLTDSQGRTTFELDSSWATLGVTLSNNLLSVVSRPGQGQPQSSLSRELMQPLPSLFQLQLPGSSTDEVAIAQANAFIKTTRTHEWLRSRAPDFSELDQPLLAIVNIASSCNAYYTQHRLNFFASSMACANTAYSTVIAHEFGHFVVERLGLSQRSFGEGFSDLLAMMVFETPAVGHGLYSSSPNPLRQPGIDVVPYPCFGFIHHCGQTLAGSFWQLRNNIAQAGFDLEIANRLFVDWLLSTGGGLGNDSAHPLTAIEVLVLDDTDGVIENGSPRQGQICNAFRSRGIYCPELNVFDINLLTPHAETQRPGVNQNIRIRVTPQYSQAAISANVVYRINEGTWLTHELSRTADDEFSGSIPMQICGAKVDYFVEVNSDSGVTQPRPSAPEYFTTFSAFSSVTLADLDFSEPTNEGWESIAIPFGTRRWVRGAPNEWYFPTQDADGSNGFWIDGAYGGAWTQGQTVLLTPSYNIPGDFFHVSYSRVVRGGAFSPAGELKVSMLQPAVSPTHLETYSGGVNSWQKTGFTRFKPNANLNVSFEFMYVRPNGTDAVVALDAFQLKSFSCQLNSAPSAAPTALHAFHNQNPQPCVADFNRDGMVNENDLTAYLDAYSTQQPSADLNDDGDVTQLDYILFIEQYNMGCY